jgi:steroid delta-isomerase-like uncharacterized protein
MPNITEVMQQMVEAWNQHDPDKIASFFAEDCFYENEFSGVVGTGREVVRKFAENGFKINPEFKAEVTNLFVSENMGAVEGVATGAHLGRRRYCNIFEYQDGVIKRMTFYITK